MKLTANEWLRLGEKLFAAAGASKEHARMVAQELVDASLMGLDSHGVMRMSQYLDQVSEGQIMPQNEVSVVFETPVSAVVDCNWNFGMVCANKMTELAIQKARQSGIAVAASRHCNHIGRLGAYPQKIAEAGLFGFAVVNSSRHGHFVAPFGGVQGRLATNPLSYAVPTAGDPIVLDMSTSMIAEGKIRVLMQQGKQLPKDCVLTYGGKATTIPQEFYEPHKGVILPFGAELGYKGFGLGLLVELLGSTLSGVALTPDGEQDSYINGLFVLAMAPSIFGENPDFISNIEGLKAYIASAKPAEGSRGVVMPGELDFRTYSKRRQEGIEAADETWRQIVKSAHKFGIEL